MGFKRLFPGAMTCRWITAFCIAMILVAAKGSAQIAGFGNIQGTVQDVSGAVIPNARVMITETATQVRHATTSGTAGAYVFPNIPIGTYILTATAPGFETYQRTQIVLEVGSSITVNATLSVGRADVSISVQSEGLSLQTEDPSFKQTIDQQNITQLPLNGRQMTDLITLSGGAVAAPANDMATTKNFYSSVAVSIAGGMGNATNYRLDGADNNDYMTNVNLPFPFPDAVSQFSVESTVLGAQDGLHPGGMVNVVTRSGSNQWHGSVFEFMRNNFLDADNFFSATNDTLHQNQYGGTFGGRIIPGKLFFFAGYQRLRASSASTDQIAYVPTQANLSGDFSSTDGAGCRSNHKAVQLVNPLTGAVLTGNQIAPSYFDKASLALQKYLPTTSDPCGQVNYSIPSLNTENQFVTRVDSVLNQKNSLYARYFLDGYQNPAYFSPTNVLITSTAGAYERVQSLTVGETYVVNSKIVNTFHATATRRAQTRGPAPVDFNPSTIGVDSYVATKTYFQLTTSSKFNVYCGSCSPAQYTDNLFSIADDVSMALGKHQIVFGGEYARNQLNINTTSNANGNFTFSGIYSQFGPTGSGGAGTGEDANLDFLTGAMSAFSQNTLQQNAERAPIPSLYAQDAYHASPRLVVTVGLRWAPVFMPVDVFNRGSIFDPTAFASNLHSAIYPNAPAGLMFYGDKGVPRAFTKNSPWQFGPNVGITYDPTGKGKTVLRTGWELTYDVPNFFTGQRVYRNPPNSASITNNQLNVPLSFSSPWSTGTQIGDPFPIPTNPTAANAIFPKSVQYIVFDQNFRPPYTIQWTASIQHEFGSGWQFQIDYIGNKTTFAPLGLPINPAVYIPGTCNGSPCSTVGNQASRFALTLANPTQGPRFAGGGGSGATWIASRADASYQGMVATIQHRLSSTFSLMANYTWSHCIDIEDAQGDTTKSTVENPNDIRMDRANCGFDYRHVANGSLIVMSNFHLNRLANTLLNNWQLAPLFHITDGQPINVSSGQDTSLTDMGNDRPNLINPGQIYTGKAITRTSAGNMYYLSAGAFAQASLGTYGNVGRNSLRGFNNVQIDAEINRSFPLKEQMALHLRLEAFNVINHPNLGNPNSSLASSTFGQVTSSGSPRIFQVAAKLTF